MRGIRQVTHVLVSLPQERRGPLTQRQERVRTDLTAEAIVQTVGRRMHHLPESRGAGPCGTLARCPYRTRMLWSIVHLIQPLAAYYASYTPPLRFGAKSTPRGRRVA